MISELNQHATEIADLTSALRRAISQNDLKNAEELSGQIADVAATLADEIHCLIRKQACLAPLKSRERARGFVFGPQTKRMISLKPNESTSKGVCDERTLWSAFGCFSGPCVQQVKAGSAVAIDDVGHMVYSYGHSKEVDERNVLQLGRRMHGTSVRLFAASDVAGYCAIASAPLREVIAGQRYVYGVALGHSTPEEA